MGSRSKNKKLLLSSGCFTLKVLAVFLCGIGLLLDCVGVGLFIDKEIGAGILALSFSLFFIVPGLWLFRKARRVHQKADFDLAASMPPVEANIHDMDVLSSTGVPLLTLAELSYEREFLNNLSAANRSKDAMDIHFAYSDLIEFYYKHRQISDELYSRAVNYCKSDIDLFPILKPLFMDDLQMIPRIPSFQRLSMLYEQHCEYEKAIEICMLGIKYELADGTQGGFSARRKRIEKKLGEKQRI